MIIHGAASVDIQKVTSQGYSNEQDLVAIEKPLNIFIGGIDENETPRHFSMTMRTPGQDDLLAMGYLYSESIINSYADVHSLESKGDDVYIFLNNFRSIDWSNHERSGLISSSCGVCGKLSLENHTYSNLSEHTSVPKIEFNILKGLATKLMENQGLFQLTGGIHAAALFSSKGEFMAQQEDVGRHNALDKLLGYCLINDHLSLSNEILLLSGRASYELLQKASRLGVKAVASIGAPSSFAIEIANNNQILLVGFLKEGGFNIYSKVHNDIKI